LSTAADQVAKGSTLHSTIALVRSLSGDDGVERVLACLGAHLPADLEAAGATDEVPLGRLLALWRAVDDELGPDHPDWPERSGAFAIDAFGVQLYAGILLKKSPEDFLTQRVSLFRLFYHPGNMEVVRVDEGHAVLRLVDFDPMQPAFCRRQTGGLLRSVQLAGGPGAAVRHVRCSLEGDAFCEWELRWGTGEEGAG
jgi:hypothetical protein